MFHLVFSGPQHRTAAFLAVLEVEGYPAQPAPDRSGFEPELLVDFVEAVAGEDYLEQLVTIAAAHGFMLRLHGLVERPTLGAF
jgi:hypothetical protein